MTMITVQHLKVATITNKVNDESEDGETKDNNDSQNSPPMVEPVCLGTIRRLEVTMVTRSRLPVATTS